MIAARTFAPPPVCEREILRYAGCRQADEGVLVLLNECLDEALPLLSYTVCFEEIDPKPFTAKSFQLARNLDGCERVMLMAATLGVGIDRLIAKYGRLSPAKALLLQAIGTERVEALCDAFCEALAEETGLIPRPRFSPGYGDLPLDTQREVLARLEAAKRLGVTLNDSLIMSPSKSVTAFVGLSHDSTQKTDKCRLCEKRECMFRGVI